MPSPALMIRRLHHTLPAALVAAEWNRTQPRISDSRGQNTWLSTDIALGLTKTAV